LERRKKSGFVVFLKIVGQFGVGGEVTFKGGVTVTMNYTNLSDTGLDGFFDKKLDVGFFQEGEKFFGISFDNG